MQDRRPLNILIIDDETNVLAIVERIIKKISYPRILNTFISERGEGGLDIFSHNAIDLVLTDIRMSDIQGLEILREVKAANSECDVIIMTGYADTENAIEALNCGASAYVRKPFSPEELMKSVTNALDKILLKEQINYYVRNLEVMVKERTARLEQRIDYEKMIAAMASEFAKAEDPVEAFDTILGLLGNCIKISRILIFCINFEREEISRMHEWAALNSDPQVDVSSKMPLFSLPKIVEEVTAGRLMAVNDIIEVPMPDRELLKRQRIKSLLILPLKVQENPIGFIRFDDCETRRVWQEDELRLLGAAADMIVQAWRRHEDIMAKQAATKQLIRTEKLSTVGTMAAGMAHEINQPLNALKVLTDSMIYWEEQGRCVSSEVVTKNLGKISKQAERIDAIIKHIRSFVHCQDQSNHESVVLNTTIKSAFSLIGRQMSSHGIAVDFQFDVDLPPIKANAMRFEQVVINLATNAMHALDTATHNDKRLVVSTMKKGDKVVVEFEDNGIGIRKEDRDKIFDPFYTTKGMNEGMGLGLSIVQAIIADAGGMISARNNTMGGATFCVELPAMMGNE